MQISDILGVVGGLALFLYGMRMMGDGLGLLAGSSLKSILESLTRNRFKGLLVGTAIAAIIQSSNATTVMVVSFVNAGLMDLSQAIGVIMGAKIGTTMTGQLLSLRADQIAPVIAMLGVCLVMFSKKKHLHYTGQVMAGLGILFLGMSMMRTSMAPLQEVAWFRNMIVSFGNPLVGILVGAAFTAMIQSSSASVGIMQAMAAQGIVSLAQAAPVIYGMNIGACISAVLAGIGAKKDARRAALLSVLVSVSGTVLFVVGTRLVPFVPWVESLTPGDPMRQVANFHSLFNIISTVFLFPFAGSLVRLSRRLLPGADVETDELRLIHIDSRAFGAVSLAIAQVDAETARMERLARHNFFLATEAFFQTDKLDMDLVNQNEETVDFLNKEITKCLVRINRMELSRADARRMGGAYHVLSDIERVGDHAQNIAEYAQRCRTGTVVFSQEAIAELQQLTALVDEILDLSFSYYMKEIDLDLAAIEEKEEHIDELVAQFSANHVTRLNDNRCNAESGLIFSEILTDLERVADHAFNIAQAARNHR
ncbi:MAG: Na/Pi cotransporter family protein [Candidatus Pelethousia sp.]|nr:Na/Pi cotransporter family protein [Candidatus Pelethousia sp.]